MSSSKYILAATAIAGGVYYYDQNVQPIFPRPNQIHQELERVEHKAAESASNLQQKLTSKIDKGKTDLSKKTSELSDTLKDTKLYPAPSATDTKEAASIVDDIKKTVSSGGDVVADLAASVKEEKSRVTRTVHGYIDFINSLGKSEKSAVEKLATEAEATANSWFDWFGKREKDVENVLTSASKEAEKTTNEWFSWGSKKSDEISSTYEDSKSKLNSRFSQEKKRAIDTFENARAQYEQAIEKASKGVDPAYQKAAQKAKEDLNKSVSELKAYGDDVYTEYSSKIKDLFSK
ncbi:predicted protein [Scheffersomyces stipitis CBS 6054]|uniref:Uncharacterized protein n=1 Tax=Scheffersomyces stipitis (strain ATCC 58785 / CBS 6054 / NBRC 10063 / NRRL Y-11545) TaxID=322104 RepID=A3M0H8_PICST|nr:predicted protein [Scheffersomyces stipitis CBS 6054]ABN68529.2 predicted protein [Scheffersomyces stipitis CBS 6054]KAG2730775.1 hypothetical protein G9P44_005924 [Scheffersomyces stipitis]